MYLSVTEQIEAESASSQSVEILATAIVIAYLLLVKLTAWT